MNNSHHIPLVYVMSTNTRASLTCVTSVMVHVCTTWPFTGRYHAHLGNSIYTTTVSVSPEHTLIKPCCTIINIVVLSPNVVIRQQQQHWPTSWNSTAVETKLESSHWNNDTGSMSCVSTVVTQFDSTQTSFIDQPVNATSASRPQNLLIHDAEITFQDSRILLKLRLISKPFSVGCR